MQDWIPPALWDQCSLVYPGMVSVFKQDKHFVILVLQGFMTKLFGLKVEYRA